MSKLIRSVALVAVVLAPFAAEAAQQAEVTARIAELRIKPSDNAPSRLKIAGGREVDVVGKSDDGRWIKVKTSFEKGDYLVALEGWMESSQLRATDGSSLGSGAPAEASSSDDMFGSGSSTSSDAGFGDDSGSGDPWAAESSSGTEASSDPFADTGSSSSSSADPWADESSSSSSEESFESEESGDSGSGDDWGDF